MIEVRDRAVRAWNELVEQHGASAQAFSTALERRVHACAVSSDLDEQLIGRVLQQWHRTMHARGLAPAPKGGARPL